MCSTSSTRLIVTRGDGGVRLGIFLERQEIHLTQSRHYLLQKIVEHAPFRGSVLVFDEESELVQVHLFLSLLCGWRARRGHDLRRRSGRR